MAPRARPAVAGKLLRHAKQAGRNVQADDVGTAIGEVPGVPALAAPHGADALPAHVNEQRRERRIGQADPDPLVTGVCDLVVGRATGCVRSHHFAVFFRERGWTLPSADQTNDSACLTGSVTSARPGGWA
jgi:hypothetical protein